MGCAPSTRILRDDTNDVGSLFGPLLSAKAELGPGWLGLSVENLGDRPRLEGVPRGVTELAFACMVLERPAGSREQES